MANQSLVLQGTDDLRRALRALGAQAVTAARGALLREAETIMTAAKGQTPVDTGTLRASGAVQPPEVLAGGQVVVTLGFGGPAAPYAVYVHERLELRHRVGSAKFLERPLLAATQGIEARLAAALRAALERGA